jgi:hypothetical protein
MMLCLSPTEMFGSVRLLRRYFVLFVSYGDIVNEIFCVRLPLRYFALFVSYRNIVNEYPSEIFFVGLPQRSFVLLVSHGDTLLRYFVVLSDICFVSVVRH